MRATVAARPDLGLDEHVGVDRHGTPLRAVAGDRRPSTVRRPAGGPAPTAPDAYHAVCGCSGAQRPVQAPGPVGHHRPVRPAPALRPPGPDPRADDGGGHPVRRLAGRLAVLLHLAHRGQGQGAALPALDHGPLRRGGPGPRPPHRPQPGGAPGHGGGLGRGTGGALPVPGPGHPLPAAVPRGLRHAGAVQGLPGDQGGPGPRDGRTRHAGRGHRDHLATPGSVATRCERRTTTRSGGRLAVGSDAADRDRRALGPGADPTPPTARRSSGWRTRVPASTWWSRTWPPSTPAWVCWPRWPASSSPSRR